MGAWCRMPAGAIGAIVRVVPHRVPFTARTTRPTPPGIGRVV